MIGKKEKHCVTKDKFGYKFKTVTTNEPKKKYIYIYKQKPRAEEHGTI